MRVVVVALQSLSIAAALAWAASAAATPGGTAAGGATESIGAASAVLPSIQIISPQSKLANSCGGGSFNVNTFINVDTQASADVRLSAPSVGTIEEFTDETGNHIGPYNGIYPNFVIPAFGGGLAPNTAVQLVITTYTGHSLSGSVSYSSSMVFNCTTGGVISLAPAPGDPSAIPTLGDAALAATAGILALLGIFALRRRAISR